jgi:dTDP-4-amino-4,6-dideoxygalactose transaminase
MLNTPFSPWPKFTDEEADAVKRVLLSNKVNYWTGFECRKFESEFASFAGTKYAIALSNGTLALETALVGLGIGAGDEVIVTSRTFLASVTSIISVGATPVFADVNCDSQNITANTVASVLSSRTRAILCVHLAGWPCDMDPIMSLASECNLFVIEDCAQAHGAMYKGKSVGSIGHVGTWSFCQDKIMTTGGEGGMVTCNDKLLWSKMWSYKDHGKSYEAVYNDKHSPGYRWVHESFGTNGRMTEIQAVIGRLQLKRIPDWVDARNINAKKIYDTMIEFSGKDGIIRVPEVRCLGCASRVNITCSCIHAYYKLYAFIRPKNLPYSWSRDRLIAEINSSGVPCYTGSCSEVYLEKAFEKTGFQPKERLPIAKELGDTSLMFLVHPTLTNEEINKTCQIIREVLHKASYKKI